MEKEYKKPKLLEQNFHCPHCGVLAFQNWKTVFLGVDNYLNNVSLLEYDIRISICQNCDKRTIWKDYKMIYPKILTSPPSSEDMPKKVKEFYEEARSIANDSPRAAAALLRVSLEELTEELGTTKTKLFDRIGELKAKGLPEKVIQSLDTVRIYANEGGSHVGEIDLTGEDGPEIVESLFKLVNFIVEKTITEQKEIENIYSSISLEKIKSIKNRDKNSI